jgi:hypothetical protein
MNAQQNPNYGILIAGIIMLFVFGSQLAVVVFQSDDIWWTPASMKLTIEESKDRVDVFIKDKRLVDMLDNGELLVQDNSETVEINNADISFRFNNFDKVRASQLTKVGITSAAVMAGLMMIAYSLVLMRKTRVAE